MSLQLRACSYHKAIVLGAGEAFAHLTCVPTTIDRGSQLSRAIICPPRCILWFRHGSCSLSFLLTAFH